MRLACLIFCALSAAFAQGDDFGIVNARIYTGNPKQPTAQTLWVKNGVIAGVGLAPFRAAKVIDARGAAILPGLIDSHGHVAELGQFIETLDFRGFATEREIAARVRTAAAARKPGEWILGNAWDQNLWPSKEFPTADSISAAAPNNPVVLTRVDGHAIWVNRRALELADLNSATPDAAGGRILRNAGGKPTGVLLDRAQALVTDRIPKPSPDALERMLLQALQECARLGITSVHDAGVSQEVIDAYHSLARKRQMPVRAYVMVRGSGPVLEHWLANGPEIGDYVTIRAVKLVADGALGSRGAALLAPYSDDPANKGLLILDRAAIRAVAQRAVVRGFQVNTHAIGDAANRAALDAYGDVLQGPNEKRFRIEHAQVVAPEDFAKFRRYSVIASMQPTHATSDMPWAQARLGPERIKGAYAWQTFMHLGVHVPSGSDFPVEKTNPILGLYAAITRQDLNGAPEGGWMPAQRMTRQEALRSWTLEGAYAAFEESRKGTLETGKLADFIMLSDDVMTMPAADIAKARVTMTVVGGRIVYRQ